MSPRRARSVAALLAAALLLQAVGFVGQAEASDGDLRDVPSRLPANPKVDPALGGVGVSSPSAYTHDATGDPLLVTVIPSGSVQAVEQTLAEFGIASEASYLGRVSARIPAGLLATVASSPTIARIERADEPSAPQEYAVTSQGTGTINATAWHTAGLRGAGVKIAVIDVGFVGYQISQSQGDLPPNLLTADFCGGRLATSSPHGTAVAEIVYDIAPEASLYLICISSPIALGAAKDYVKGQGVKIVSMSTGFYGTSRGDGLGGPTTPEGIVADARAAGILWVNATANSARSHWSGRFVSQDGDGWHDFDSGPGEQNGFTLATDQRICIHLKWDEWPSATSDYDLYMYRASDTATPVARSERDSFYYPAARPVEVTCYINPGPAERFFVSIYRVAGSGTPRLDLFDNSGGILFEYQTAEGSVSEPATSPAAMGVGAVCWQGNLLGLFSSRGPTIDGRIKPDIVAPTQVTTSPYGSSTGCTGGFGGTSGAAPHVAGAAALVAQANPMSTPQQIQLFLEQRAQDAGAPGKDNFYGAGILTLGAPLAIPPEPPVVAPPLTFTVYLPNITRMLGGRYGWHTPFIVQNVGTVSTALRVQYFSFSNGALVATRNATLLPGRSFVGSPNDEGDLPANAQFSVVITSTGAPVVAVVNEHQGGPGVTPEALSYSGFSAGSTKVSLPLVSKMAGGWFTTMIIQNLGTVTTSVSASFRRLDGTGTPMVISRAVQPGRSQFIDPRFESTLASGAEYAVTLTATQPVAVVANAHNDLPGVPMPMGDSYNGIPDVTGTTTYLPYVAKNADGVGRSTRIVVQNAGAGAATPNLSFVRFGQTAVTSVSGAMIQPGASWSLTPTLADGEYSLKVDGGTFAVVAAAISPATAMFYAGTTTATSRLFLPNVTRRLSAGAGDPGWTTPILVHSTNATSATLRWYRFSDGSLVTTQNVPLLPGATTRVNPQQVPLLNDNSQYAVVLESPGQVVAIVTELNALGGDNAMIYTGFVPEASVALTRLSFDGQVPDTESDEFVELQNLGGAPQNMTGWKIVSVRAGQTFTFGALTIQPGQTCRLYTNENHPEWCSLNWMRPSAQWNNTGDRVNLVDASGRVVSSIGYKGY